MTTNATLFTSNTILNYYVIHAGQSQGKPVDKVGDPNERKRTTRNLLCRCHRGVEQAKELPASKRTHWCCSLRIIAKALDRPPESIAARCGAVALKVNQLHHANSAVEWKTLANHKSNAKAALFWFRDEQGLPRRGTPLKPEWQQLRRRLKDLSRQGKLSGLIRYCSLKGIAPGVVDEAVVDAYMAYRKETTALAVDIKARRGIARAWNASRGIEGWPQQQLIEPPLKAKEGPRWEDFPQQLQADIASHLKFLNTHRKSPSGKHLRPCKPLTLQTRRNDLVSFAKKAVRLGTQMEGLSSLSVLLAPDLVERILDKKWEQNGEEPKPSTIDLAKKLVAVARSTNCLTKEQLTQLDDKRAALEEYRKEGMTQKNSQAGPPGLEQGSLGQGHQLPGSADAPSPLIERSGAGQSGNDRPDRSRCCHAPRSAGTSLEPRLHPHRREPDQARRA